MRLRIVEGPPQWLAEKTGAHLTPWAHALAAVDSFGRIRGMVAYDLWTPNACFLHVALESPVAGRALLDPDNGVPVFEYPFLTCGRSILYGLTPSNRKRALRLNAHLGFRRHSTLKDALEPGVDLILFELRREDCHWLNTRRAA